MSEWTHSDRRITTWAATSVPLIVVVYVIVGLVGVAARPPSTNPLNQVDPYLAVLEILLSLAAIALVVLMSAVYSYAPPDRKASALAALAFVIAFAILTCTVHFVSLTVGRQLDLAAFPLVHRQLIFGEWPS